MDSNISYSDIKNYSKLFTSKVLDKYYQKKETIGGEELLLLTPVQQVNLFVVFELLTIWKKEVSQLQSPYFNYQNDKVQEALQKFMNVLSKHIVVKREDLEPLVVRATEKAILLIFSPYQYYKSVFNSPDYSRLSISTLKELNKYVKINKHLLEDMVSHFEKESIEEVFNEDALTIFDDICENTTDTPEDFEIYITMFNEIAMIDITRFYTEEEQLESTSPTEQKVDNDEKEFQNLNDKLQVEQETLADVHAKKGVEGLKKSITINQRFMFVNELFDGNSDEFESVVSYLDNCEDKYDAMDYIQANYAEPKGWDLASEEYEEFVEVISKRFPD